MRGSTPRSYDTKAGKRWRYEIEYRDATGQPVRINKGGFATKREAAEDQRDELLALDRGVTGNRHITLAEYAATWIKRHPAKRKGNYERDLNTKVLPTLGHLKLRDVDRSHLDALYVDLRDHGGVCLIKCGKPAPCGHGRPLAPKTVSNIHVAVHALFASAVLDKLISDNPATHVANKPKVKQTGRRRNIKEKCWTLKELRAFLDAHDGHPLKVAWMLLALTGMRRGELLALRWEDIDFDRGIARIDQFVAPDAKTGHPVWDVTGKSDNAERVIALDERTLAGLRQHRKDQLADRLMWGPDWRDDTPVVWAEPEQKGRPHGDLVFREYERTRYGGKFVALPGQPIDPKRFTKQTTRAQRRAGLKPVSVSGLRHTYATIALRSGVDPDIVRDRMGHESVATTYDHYGFVFEKDDAAAAATIADAIWGGG